MQGKVLPSILLFSYLNMIDATVMVSCSHLPLPNLHHAALPSFAIHIQITYVYLLAPA